MTSGSKRPLPINGTPGNRRPHRPALPARARRVRRSRTVLALLACVTVLVAVGGYLHMGAASGTERALPSPMARSAQAFGAADGLPSLGPTVPHPVASDWEVPTIVIDAGHGGSDPGAVGPTGLQEKTVTLDVSNRLERRLTARGYRVHMTRTADVNLSLNARAAKAAETQADLFVSVHVNSLPQDNLVIIETFYYRGRSWRMGKRLAVRENDGSGHSRSAPQTEEAATYTVTAEKSKALAEEIQRALVTHIQEINPDARDWGTRPGWFRVVRRNSVPAVLAELTVLSAPEEEERLATAEYRDTLARALEAGIVAYLAR